MSAPEGTGSREHRSFLIPVALTAVLGVVGIAWSTSHTPPFENETVAEVAHGLSEALFIAAFVAAVVDPYAKRRFAVEVGRSVLLALFGRNAPQRYIDGLRDALRPDRVTFDVEWQLRLDWHRRSEVLRVDVRVDSTVQNISETPMATTPAWLPSSVTGSPGTQFLEYRVRVTPASGPASGIITQALNTDELQHAASTERGRWIALDLDQLLDRLRVPPGATQDFTLAGVAYEAVPALFPLVLSNPALRQTVKIGGPALPDLNVDVFFGTKALECTILEVGGERQCQYAVEDLALPGGTWRIQWDKVNAAAPAPAAPS